ncbi:hypothetical protein HKB36_25820 [Vibrio parahaemolyticus]|uniref:hypothetical protein n=1 Tax=Vibrio parahaemolyticus TaxID=670 RepID=UPI00146F5472|nr:hypothetical protein [Vibrio parahaemolyticus]MDF5453501.1 hypothetical protein [Vibrio parahaemolyticus]NMS06418.1 hypothetical protein [Vibrio parahaemolyticus]
MQILNETDVLDWNYKKETMGNVLIQDFKQLKNIHQEDKEYFENFIEDKKDEELEVVFDCPETFSRLNKLEIDCIDLYVILEDCGFDGSEEDLEELVTVFYSLLSLDRFKFYTDYRSFQKENGNFLDYDTQTLLCALENTNCKNEFIDESDKIFNFFDCLEQLISQQYQIIEGEDYYPEEPTLEYSFRYQ